MNVKTEWKSGPDFAEMAEALRIRTTQIMAAYFNGEGRLTVIYTPELEEDDLDPGTPLYVARLERDADRILMLVGEPILTEFDWADLEAEIERRLNDECA
jgi:hypothetical protein